MSHIAIKENSNGNIYGRHGRRFNLECTYDTRLFYESEA